MNQDTRPKFTPADFYRALPNEAVEPPALDEPGESFARRCRGCGDGLYEFLARELFAEPISRREAIERMNNVLNEVHRVVNAVRA